VHVNRIGVHNPWSSKRNLLHNLGNRAIRGGS
jgi:hypothetical protein